MSGPVVTATEIHPEEDEMGASKHAATGVGKVAGTLFNHEVATCNPDQIPDVCTEWELCSVLTDGEVGITSAGDSLLKVMCKADKSIHMVPRSLVRLRRSLATLPGP